jgi:hypothetical protein
LNQRSQWRKVIQLQFTDVILKRKKKINARFHAILLFLHSIIVGTAKLFILGDAMSIQKLLLTYLLMANISEYAGSIENLSKMIYWVTGEVPNKTNLYSFMSHSKKIGQYCIERDTKKCQANNRDFPDLF